MVNDSQTQPVDDGLVGDSSDKNLNSGFGIVSLCSDFCD